MLLSEIIEKAHANSRDKGWWDGVELPLSGVRFVPEKIALIHSEISEALECYRDGQMAAEYIGPEGGSPYSQAEADEIMARAGLLQNPVRLKPVGFPSELADVVIRCADLLGALGAEPEGTDCPDDRPPQPVTHVGDNLTVVLAGGQIIPDSMAYLHLEVSKAFQVMLDRDYLIYGLVQVAHETYAIARANNIDLDAAIQTKMAYNTTRPHRHGGKRC